jgi:UDP-N-acetyl-D-galactosamine dehydrogenase
MGAFVAQRIVKLLARANVSCGSARVGVLGFTFKENVPDLRNTKVVDVVRELQEFGIEPLVHDPLASPEDALREFGLHLKPWSELMSLDALLLAVPHREFLARDALELLAPLRRGGAFLDLKSAFVGASLRPDVKYWSL